MPSNCPVGTQGWERRQAHSAHKISTGMRTATGANCVPLQLGNVLHSTWPAKEQDEEDQRPWCSVPDNNWLRQQVLEGTKNLSRCWVLAVKATYEHCRKSEGAGILCSKQEIGFSAPAGKSNNPKVLHNVVISWKCDKQRNRPAVGNCEHQCFTMVGCSFSPTTWEAEERGSLSSRIDWSTEQILGQPVLERPWLKKNYISLHAEINYTILCK